MATQLKIADVEAAIIAVLKADAAVIADGAQVAGISSKAFDDQGALIVTPPAILVLFEQLSDDPRTDLTRLTYNTALEFALFCGHQNLGSTDNERSNAYALVAHARAALAGKRFTIDGRNLAPVALNGVQLLQFDQNGVWYTAVIRVADTAQFG